MPLLKKKPFALVAPPDDLRPDETVWQVRFTNEIFRSYPEYLERMNLFRQRLWSCSLTRKMHLTYEEALMSEEQTSAKLRKFPQLFTAHVLCKVQFSMLSMNDLVTMIVDNLIDTFVQGEEVLGNLENSNRPCKIMKVLSCDGDASYEVGWLNKKGEVTTTSIENKHKFTRKKIPFSRGLLKLFIIESTSQSFPWVIHNELAKKYGISTKPPKEIEDKINNCQETERTKTSKKKGSIVNDASTAVHTMKTVNTVKKVEEIKYPIEDLLVKPSANDPAFTARPVPSNKFLIPLDDVGNLLAVWDFLSCFGKLLCLSRFTLDELENAIVYEGISNLIIEAHICLLTLLIDNQGEYYDLILQKKRNTMITSKGWNEYLCDFLELENKNKFAQHITKIKKHSYSMLGVHFKLEVLSELVSASISTEAIRDKIDTCIEQQQALVANKREEDLEEIRQRREDKRLKVIKDGDHESDLNGVDQATSGTTHILQNDLVKDVNKNASPSIEIGHEGKRVSKIDVLKSRRELMKKNLEEKVAMERTKENSRLEDLKRLREENKARVEETKKRKQKEQRLMHFEREMEKLHFQTVPLGKDRDHNRYWFFHLEGRLFVESADNNSWGYYSSEDEVNALMDSLNPKGVRESSLYDHLEKYHLKICTAFEKRSKELARRVGLEDPAIFRRRSVRVSAPPKDKNKAPSFLTYVNKWRTE